GSATNATNGRPSGDREAAARRHREREAEHDRRALGLVLRAALMRARGRGGGDLDGVLAHDPAHAATALDAEGRDLVELREPRGLLRAVTADEARDAPS